MKENKTGKKRSLMLKILVAVLVVLLLLLLAAVIAFNYVLSRFGRFEDDPLISDTTPVTDEFVVDESVAGGETLITVDPTDITMTAVEELQGDVINVMLIGQDRRPGEGRARSDTMILISINEEKGSILMTSFMRDTYVQIPGYLDNRLNAAYRYGGTELMNETFLVNFGIQIDGNVMVDFEAFQDVIDILGGVDLYVTENEAMAMRMAGFDGTYAGMNHLDAEAAMYYARVRWIDSDYNRTQRQRKVLLAIADSLRNADIITILDLIDQVLPCIVTNLSNAQIVDYTTIGLGMLANGTEIETLRIPANDAHYSASIRGMAVLVPDLQMCREDLEAFIYLVDVPETTEAAEVSEP